MKHAIVTMLFAASSGCLTNSVELSSTEGLTYEAFKAHASVEPWAGGGFIIDGDVPVDDEQELYAIWISMERGALAVKSANGADVVWSAQQKLALTYCVSDSFDDLKAEVVGAMAAATSAWEAAANVNFTYLPAQDAACTAANANVVFDVSPLPAMQNPPLARAFFPDDVRDRRNVLIDQTAFDYPTWSLAGILRHELGHTLGFRHEHIRPEAMSQCTESADYRAVTAYDKSSVMHYPQCNGVNMGDLVLTASDKAGAASVYGPPGGAPPPSNPPSNPEPPLPTGTGDSPVLPPPTSDESGGCHAGGQLSWATCFLGFVFVAVGRRRRATSTAYVARHLSAAAIICSKNSAATG